MLSYCVIALHLGCWIVTEDVRANEGLFSLRTGLTPQECQAECLSSSLCKAFNWWPDATARNCELSSSTSVTTVKSGMVIHYELTACER